MRHPTRSRPAAQAMVLLLVVAGAIAGCGASGPASPGTPAASGPAATQPDLTPVVPTPVGGSEAPAPVVVTALNLAFQPSTVTAPAGVPFTLLLDNRDQGIPHGLAVVDPSGDGVAKGEVAAGPARVPLVMPALAAGSYTFSCQVHPNMTGTLTVAP